jgi:hypothetical protein
LFARHTNRGTCSGLSALARPSTLLRGERPLAPFRVSGLLHRSTSRLVWPCGFPRTLRQDASNPLLQPTFHVTSTRDETSPLKTARRALWETRQRSTSRRLPDAAFPLSRPRTAPDHLAVIRPPAAPCLTARRRLWPARLPRSRSCAGGGEAPPLFRLARAPPMRTSDASRGRRDPGTPKRPFFPSHERVPSGCTSMRADFPALEAPSAAGVQRELPLGSPGGALRPLAGGGSYRTCSSWFENPD